MNLAVAAKIIRFKPSLKLPGQGSPFVAQPEADGRALLTRTPSDRSESSRLGAPTVPKTLLVGLDIGTHHTRLLAEYPGVEQFYLKRRIATAVAMQKAADEKTVSPFLYFGDEALTKGNRFEITRPLQNGELENPVLAREFVRHLRSFMQREHLATRAVVAMPPTLSEGGRHNFRMAMKGLLDEVVFLPRPYLSGLGLKRKLGLKLRATGDSSGPVLLVDMGGACTEICRVSAEYPDAADMESVVFGGDHVDRFVAEALRRDYPALNLPMSNIRLWKDSFGFTGQAPSPVVVKIPIDGTEQSIQLTQSLKRGCDVWAMHVFELIHRQLQRPGPEVRDVYLTGEGRQLGGLTEVLEGMLTQAGHEGLRIHLVGEDDTSLVALGSLAAARRVGEHQWARFQFQ